MEKLWPIPVLGEGEACKFGLDDLDDVIESARDLLSGINAREAVNEVIDAVLPCGRGLVCRRVSLDNRVCMAPREGQCFLVFQDKISINLLTITGPCSQSPDAGMDCDNDGNFMPLQCRMIPGSRRYQCRCVEPSGIPVPDTETEVDSPRNGPDCEDIGKKYLTLKIKPSSMPLVISS